MEATPLRVGLVGAGNVAQAAHLPTLAGDSGVTLAGVVTRSHESAERNLRRWPIERAYATIEELVADARLDCLLVLSPRREHAAAVEIALRHGIDVFSEKPLADTSAEARRLADLAISGGRILMVDLNRRYAPAYRAAREAFRDGSVQFCVAQKNRAGSEYRATLENAIHMVDLLRWFCGQAVEVSAHSVAPDRWHEDGLAALIRFDGGAIGCMMAARTAGEWDERLDAYGGMTSVRVIAPDTVIVTKDGESTLIEQRPRAFGWVSGTQALGFEDALMHFLECVRTRDRPLTDGHEAADTQALLEQVLERAELPLADDPRAAWASRSQQ